MPSYEYSREHKAWVKQCSRCKDITVGTEDQDESYRIFQNVFAWSGPSSGMADGLQSRCTHCNSRSRRELGVTRTVIEGMHKAQNGKCAICTKDISIVRYAPADTHAHVDHNDDTGEIRELLCGNCNRGIGLLGHNTLRLRRAIAYINKHSVVVIPFKRRA